MKQGKKTLQEAFKTFHLIARFGKGLFLLAFLVSSLNAVAPLLIVVGNTQILNEIVNRKSQNVPLLIAYFYVVAGFSYVIAAFLQRDLEIKLVQANEQLKLAIYEAWETVDFQELETQGYFSKMMKSEASFRYSGGVPAFLNQFQGLVQGCVTLVVGLGLISWLGIAGIAKDNGVTIAVLLSTLILLFGEYLLIRLYRVLTHSNIKVFQHLMGLERTMNYFLMNIINSYENIKSIKMWGLSGPIQNRYHATWMVEKQANQDLIINDSCHIMDGFFCNAGTIYFDGF
ncbi:MAG: hypothetical protein ABF639_10720 [Lacticaseibacillus paracasei]|uniref:hypothetical protein n=1 Tax=Lacticaseibacillus paracasei TaxID=1597 RepID=UPI00345D7E7D